MSLPKYFIISGFQVGPSQAGTLQYLDGDGNWIDLGNWAARGGTIIINARLNPILIPWLESLDNIDGDELDNIDGSPLDSGGIFYPGGTWSFRLADQSGDPVSNIVTFTFPTPEQPLLNIGGQGLENIGGGPLINV